MAFKGVSSYCWGVGFTVGLFFLFFLNLIEGYINLGSTHVGAFFSFDGISFFLSMISLVLGLSLYSWWDSLSVSCRAMLCVSVLMSFICFCSSNSLVFWASYELCILPLLYLLVSESSYSERFVAFWYLLGYVVLTSVPLILSIIYLCGVSGSFSLVQGGLGFTSWSALFVICVCFITKIPLPPFHVWLPIVHAEASSPVSVCLSGFIMKLGILGVFRFSYLILPYDIFSYHYVVVIFFFSVGFLFLSSQELDGKRWLAVLSLSHIVLSAVGAMVVFFSSRNIPFVYCLGHGFSAGLVFILLWLMYNLIGSRNWNILKYGAGASLFFRLLLVGSLCTVASLPPTISFFSEICIFMEGGLYSLFLSLVFLMYLFFSGLIPMFVLGGCLSRHFSICSCFHSFSLGYPCIFVLLLFCFLLFFFL